MTPSVPISPDSWCLSLAKFLELKFYGHSYKKRDIETEQGSESMCDHSLHKDYIQYFSSNGVIVSFMYQPVDVWEIKLPSLTVELQLPEYINHLSYVDKIKNQAQKGYEIYAKIHEKLANLSSDVELPMLVKLKKVLHRDQLLFKHRVEVVQTLLAGKVFDKYEISDAILLVQKVGKFS